MRLPLYPRLLSSDAGSGPDVWVRTSRFPMCLSVHQKANDDNIKFVIGQFQD